MNWADIQNVPWKAVPSCNIIIPTPGTPVTWSVITNPDGDEVVGLIHGLPELLARYLANSHNLLLTKS